MNMTEPTRRFEKANRYKNYPITHFSHWRFLVYFLTLRLIITPVMWILAKPRISGRQHVPKSGPYIVAANHLSNNDPLMVAMAVDYPVAYMGKAELFENRFSAWFNHTYGCFALDRDKPDSATLKTALNVLKSPAKWALGIFPEGTRSTTGELLPLKKGIGALAIKTGVPVVPVGIQKMPNGEHHLQIGEPLTGFTDADTLQDAVEQTLKKLMKKNQPSVAANASDV